MDVAAEGSRIQPRLLTALADLSTANEVFAEVWGTGSPVMPVDLMRAMAHADGYVAGAFDGQRMVGASVGFLALHGGRLCLHSHVTGVIPDARGLHVGTTLKQHQRDWALERGIATITWTFDPLIRRNAWFNLGRLGARPIDYLIDFYGDLGDEINAGDESDRLLVSWDLATPAGEGVMLPAAYERVGTPADIESLRRSDRAAAQAWRRRLRDALLVAARERRIVGFTREGDYVIAPSSEVLPMGTVSRAGLSTR